MNKNMNKKFAAAILAMGIGMSFVANAGRCFCAEPDVLDDGTLICLQYVCW